VKRLDAFNHLGGTAPCEEQRDPIEPLAEDIRRVARDLRRSKMAIEQTSEELRATEHRARSGALTWKPYSRILLLGLSASLPGMPGQFREKIFVPYFSTKQHGTGLGLRLACRILTDHCGSIKVVKHQYAAGATFLIDFPIT
jgi:nitrogen fixation/metabolism regulation signal transduction histidine kinase